MSESQPKQRANASPTPALKSAPVPGTVSGEAITTQVKTGRVIKQPRRRFRLRGRSEPTPIERLTFVSYREASHEAARPCRGSAPPATRSLPPRARAAPSAQGREVAGGPRRARGWGPEAAELAAGPTRGQRGVTPPTPGRPRTRVRFPAEKRPARARHRRARGPQNKATHTRPS